MKHYIEGVLIESWDDDTRTYTDHRTGETRPYTAEENEAADESAASDARMDDLEARVAALEAIVMAAPVPDDPADPTVPTWADLVPAGWWYDGTLLRDGGKVWRNVSGTVLTTPPSGFPGAPSQWTHLFVEATTAPDPDPDPDPTRPEGYVGVWSANGTYAVGDVVERDGVYYRCLVAHGPEYQGTWGPPQGSVWTDLGPVG